MPELRAADVMLPPMPAAGALVPLSPGFSPSYLTGLVIHPDNALQFDFLVHKGDMPLTGDAKTQEYSKLVRYFLAALTVPDKDQWVNLSPYEHNRIIENNFGQTVMGRDLLAQDYLLKQITSSLMYPESGLGKSFWDKVYAELYKRYGTTSTAGGHIPVNTFNKVWIVPDQAVVYESGHVAYVVKSHLKVMLEEDYLAATKNGRRPQATAPQVTQVMIREVILPVLEREVNEGKNFAQLRQVFASMLLATWYKKALKESLLGRVYADQAKVQGVNQPDCRQAGTRCEANEAIYQQYLEAFKKGVYNYIKEDADAYTHQVIPRKYFAGGMSNRFAEKAQIVHVTEAAIASAVNGMDEAMAVELDAALPEVQTVPLFKELGQKTRAGRRGDRAMLVLDVDKILAEFQSKFSDTGIDDSRAVEAAEAFYADLDQYLKGLLASLAEGRMTRPETATQALQRTLQEARSIAFRAGYSIVQHYQIGAPLSYAIFKNNVQAYTTPFGPRTVIVMDKLSGRGDVESINELHLYLVPHRIYALNGSKIDGLVAEKFEPLARDGTKNFYEPQFATDAESRMQRVVSKLVKGFYKDESQMREALRRFYALQIIYLADHGAVPSNTSDFVGYVYNILHGDTALAFALLVDVWKNPKNDNVFIKETMERAGTDALVQALGNVASDDERVGLIQQFFAGLMQTLGLSVAGEISEAAASADLPSRTAEDIIAFESGDAKVRADLMGLAESPAPANPMIDVSPIQAALADLKRKLEEGALTDDEVDRGVQAVEAAMSKFRNMRIQTQAEKDFLDQNFLPIMRQIDRDLERTLIRHGYHVENLIGVNGRQVRAVYKIVAARAWRSSKGRPVVLFLQDINATAEEIPGRDPVMAGATTILVRGVRLSAIEQAVDRDIMPLLDDANRDFFQVQQKELAPLQSLATQFMRKFLAKVSTREDIINALAKQAAIEAVMDPYRADMKIQDKAYRKLSAAFGRPLDAPAMVKAFERMQSLIQGDSWLAVALLIRDVIAHPGSSLEVVAFGGRLIEANGSVNPKILRLLSEMAGKPAPVSLRQFFKEKFEELRADKIPPFVEDSVIPTGPQIADSIREPSADMAQIVRVKPDAVAAADQAEQEGNGGADTAMLSGGDAAAQIDAARQYVISHDWEVARKILDRVSAQISRWNIPLILHLREVRDLYNQTPTLAGDRAEKKPLRFENLSWRLWEDGTDWMGELKKAHNYITSHDLSAAEDILRRATAGISVLNVEGLAELKRVREYYHRTLSSSPLHSQENVVPPRAAVVGIADRDRIEDMYTALWNFMLVDSGLPFNRLNDSPSWAKTDADGNVIGQRSRFAHIDMEIASLKALEKGDWETWKGVDGYGGLTEGEFAAWGGRIRRLSERGREILRLGGILHDVGYADVREGESHQGAGVRLAKNFIFSKLDVSPLVAEAVLKVIEAHSDPYNLATSREDTRQSLTLTAAGLNAWLEGLLARGILQPNERGSFMAELQVIFTAISLADIHASGDRHLNVNVRVQDIARVVEEAFSVRKQVVTTGVAPKPAWDWKPVGDAEDPAKQAPMDRVLTAAYALLSNLHNEMERTRLMKILSDPDTYRGESAIDWKAVEEGINTLFDLADAGGDVVPEDVKSAASNAILDLENHLGGTAKYDSERRKYTVTPPLPRDRKNRFLRWAAARVVGALALAAVGMPMYYLLPEGEQVLYQVGQEGLYPDASNGAGVDRMVLVRVDKIMNDPKDPQNYYLVTVRTVNPTRGVGHWEHTVRVKKGEKIPSFQSPSASSDGAMTGRTAALWASMIGSLFGGAFVAGVYPDFTRRTVQFVYTNGAAAVALGAGGIASAATAAGVDPEVLRWMKLLPVREQRVAIEEYTYAVNGKIGSIAVGTRGTYTVPPRIPGDQPLPYTNVEVIKIEKQPATGAVIITVRNPVRTSQFPSQAGYGQLDEIWVRPDKVGQPIPGFQPNPSSAPATPLVSHPAGDGRGASLNRTEPYGGIDLNSANFDMVIKRDGQGVPLPLSQQDMAQLGRIAGFVPKILEIRPAVTLPLISRYRQEPADSPLLARAS